jgi:hypothetical protein
MISSNYHMDRAVRNAAEGGFANIMRLPAPSNIWAYGANRLSEVVLDLNDLMKKQRFFRPIGQNIHSYCICA